MNAVGRAAPVSQWQLARRDLVEGLRAHRVWMLLARMDIRQRYRRSIIGPFWITVAMVIWILALGPLYSRLLGVGADELIPYVAMGIIGWGLISGLILEGAAAFVGAEHLVRSIKLPYTAHVLRVMQRNLVVFAHNLLAFVPFMLYLRIAPRWEWLASALGVALIMVAALPASILLGTLSARFRDLQQMIASIVQLAFFVTPIFWKAEMLKDRAWLAEYNPFQVMLELVRRPIVDGIPPAATYGKMLLIIVVLFALALPFFAHYRRRLALWV